MVIAILIISTGDQAPWSVGQSPNMRRKEMQMNRDLPIFNFSSKNPSQMALIRDNRKNEI